MVIEFVWAASPSCWEPNNWWHWMCKKHEKCSNTTRFMLYIIENISIKWILHVYLLELYKNIDCFCWSYNLIWHLPFQNHNLYLCDNICVTLSQGHPSMGVRSFGPFPGEELWDYHLTLGRPYGGTVALCRTQLYPGIIVVIKQTWSTETRHSDMGGCLIITWVKERNLDTGAGYLGFFFFWYNKQISAKLA